MFKIAGRVLDFYDDPEFIGSTRAQRLLGRHLVPIEAIHKLADENFAAVIVTPTGRVRRWPVFNKIATMLSGAYFCRVRDELPEELRKTAAYHLQKAHAKFGAAVPSGLDEPVASRPDRIVDVSPPSDESRLPPLDWMAKAAQQDFLENLGRYAPQERFVRANQIFGLFAKAASSLDASADDFKERAVDLVLDPRVWDYVEKEHAGPYFPEEVKTRHHMLKHGSNQALADTFVGILKNAKGAGLRKFAEALYRFDKMAELDSRYDRGLRDPFLAVFGGLTMQKLGAPAEELLKWKLQTLCREGRELGKIFEPVFLSKFQNDPEKTYREAGPVEKRILTSLMSKIPSPAVSHLNPEMSQKHSPGQGPLGAAVEDAQRALTGA